VVRLESEVGNRCPQCGGPLEDRGPKNLVHSGSTKVSSHTWERLCPEESPRHESKLCLTKFQGSLLYQLRRDNIMLFVCSDNDYCCLILGKNACSKEWFLGANLRLRRLFHYFLNSKEVKMFKSKPSEKQIHCTFFNPLPRLEQTKFFHLLFFRNPICVPPS